MAKCRGQIAQNVLHFGKRRKCQLAKKNKCVTTKININGKPRRSAMAKLARKKFVTVRIDRLPMMQMITMELPTTHETNTRI
jgi:hypothetical protein